jgi:hypothetical protein
VIEGKASVGALKHQEKNMFSPISDIKYACIVKTVWMEISDTFHGAGDNAIFKLSGLEVGYPRLVF